MGLASPCTPLAAAPPPTLAPNPPKSTLASERFIALHMMLVRISPLAPTSDPATISTLLPKIKPAALAAMPEYAFKSAITIGISAPPMGIVSVTPKTSDARAAKRKSR